MSCSMELMAALPPGLCFRNQSSLCYYSYAHNICTYSLDLRLLCVSSASPLRLLCFLNENKAAVFLYIRNWINQIRFILQALHPSVCLGDLKMRLCPKAEKLCLNLSSVCHSLFFLCGSPLFKHEPRGCSQLRAAGEPFQGISCASSVFSSTLPILSFHFF